VVELINTIAGQTNLRLRNATIEGARRRRRTGSASRQVLSAQSLSTDSNRLKLEVGKFLSSVRAA
jgi:hypothetical protein